MREPMTVVCADTHLQTGAWAKYPIYGDSYYSLEQIIDYTLARDLRHVVGAGDLLDRQINESQPIYNFVAQLARLHETGGIFDFIQGQHDLQETPWLLNSPAARHMHKLQVELANGSLMYGLDYRPAGQLQAELDLIPAGTDIGVFHQVWHEFMGGIANPQGSMGDVPVVSIVVTGDYHVATHKNTTGKDGQPISLWSPGSTCMQSIDEPDEKSFLVLYDDLTFDRVPLITRKYFEYGVYHPGDVDSLVADSLPFMIEKLLDESAGFDERIRKPIIRVVFSASLPETRRRVIQAAAGRVHLFFKEEPLVSRDTETAYVTKAGTPGGPTTVVTLGSSLSDYVAAKQLDRLEPACRRLLDTHDVGGELRRMKEETLSQQEVS